MGNLTGLWGRGWRFVRKYGILSLYRKMKERQERNRAEKGYESWLFQKLPGEEETQSQRKREFPFAPVISVLVPVYETPENFLRQMLESVLNQSYEKLELCITDGSPSDRVRRVVEEYALQDSRIRYQKLEKNLGIAGNTNAALEQAAGAYVGLLDHDDLLLPGALYEIVQALNEGEPADAVYTDEDKLDPENNRHFQPHFKPDFNPEYLRSNNYICHFFVVKREIALRTGGFREEFDGAQDHDFIFRCTEQSRKVIHIPKVLYSWRCHAASTASNPESKLYAYEAGRRAVAAHLDRTGRTGRVLNTENYGFFRVQYPGSSELLIKSFENFDGHADVNVVYYDKACNNSVTISGKKNYVLFTCVRDAKVNAGFFSELMACCNRPETGLACARVYGKNRRLCGDIRMVGVQDPFSEGMRGKKAGYSGYFHRILLQQELERPTDCFMIRRELLGENKEVSVPELWKQLKKEGYFIYYEPWAVMYENR